MQQAIMPKEKTADYYCLHHQNLMLTSNTSLPDECACLWNWSFLVKLSKGIAVESRSKLSHNLPNLVLINVDVTAMAMKQSLILQLIKLSAVLTCTVERRCPVTYTYTICTRMKAVSVWNKPSCFFPSLVPSTHCFWKTEVVICIVRLQFDLQFLALDFRMLI
jgi:hypothetical protein